MGDLSNKSLTLFLLASIVISLFGTLFILNKAGSSYGPTGFAPSDTGMVNITVSATVSITTNESPGINFGGCTLNESNTVYINSLRTESTTTYCTAFAAQDNISVRNDGNVAVNVSIAASACAPGEGNSTCTFLNYSSAPSYAANGLFQFSTNSSGLAGYQGGCTTANGTWTTFNGTHQYRACTNLNNVNPTNSFLTNFRLRLPPGLGIGAQTTTLTYTAAQT